MASVDADISRITNARHALPSDAVCERPEEEASEGTHEERRGEDGEGVQQCGGLVARREELVGDVGGEKAVDREVEPLDGVTDGGASDRLSDRAGFGSGTVAASLVDGHGSSSWLMELRCARRGSRTDRAVTSVMNM